MERSCVSETEMAERQIKMERSCVSETEMAERQIKMERSCVSETEMAERQKLLDDVNGLLAKCQTDVTHLLEELDWTPDHFIQPRKVVTCSYDSSHKMPTEKLTDHIQRCQLRQKGCSTEDVETILDNSSYFYENASCVFAVKIDKDILNKALWDHHVKNHSVYYGTEKMPMTPDEERVLLSREDRLGLGEYVISKAKEADRLAKLEKDELQASANLADLLKEEEAGGGRKLDHIEELAAMRDFRRRRQSYRAKNVHITKKSHTEIIREVITNQMEMYSQSLKDQCPDDKDTDDTNETHSRPDEKDRERNTGERLAGSSESRHRIERERNEDRDKEYREHDREKSRGYEKKSRGGDRDRGESEIRYIDDDRQGSKDTERCDKKGKKKKSTSKRDRSNSRSPTRDRSTAGRSSHPKKHHKKHKHKHKKDKYSDRTRSKSRDHSKSRDRSQDNSEEEAE